MENGSVTWKWLAIFLAGIIATIGGVAYLDVKNTVTKIDRSVTRIEAQFEGVLNRIDKLEQSK